ASLSQQTSFSYVWSFSEAVQFLQATTQAGDVVYVPNDRVFWGIGWYFVKPGSVHPLALAPLETEGGVEIYPKSAFKIPADGKNYWVVFRDSDSTDPVSPRPDRTHIWDFRQLKVMQVRP